MTEIVEEISNPIVDDDNPDFYTVPYCDMSTKTSDNSLSPIEKRLQLFYELQNNEWFGVMNWVLDQLRHTDPLERRRCMWGHVFYFEYKKLRHPVYDYKNLW